MTEPVCLHCRNRRPPSNPHFCSNLCSTNYFANVRNSHPTAAFCRSRGIELKREGILLRGFCPFHQERTPSFFVFPDGGCRCFGCDWPEKGSASVIDLCATLDGLRPIQAAVKLATGSAMSEIAPVKRMERKKTLLMPSSEPPTQADYRQLSVRRTIAIVALVIACQRDFLRCFDDEINGRCWLFTDRRKKCAIRRRLDNQPFQLRSGSSSKAAACFGADMTKPLGYEEARDYPAFSVVEGGPNGLAAIAQAYAAGVEDLVAPIVMPCTGSNFHPESLESLKGKRGRIFPDADKSGREAAYRWAKQLFTAGIVVDGFDFGGLVQINGQPVSALNDFCKLDPDSDDKHRSATESLMGFAHTHGRTV
jgi:hypothetical protein